MIVTKEAGVTWHNAVALAPKPGYLSVRLITRIEHVPVKGLSVRFFESDARGNQGDEVTTEALESDENGLAFLDKIVDAGCYLCVVEGETSEVIMPVEKKEAPEDIMLPRAYLAVRVIYEGELLGELDVRFFEADKDGNMSDVLVGKVKTGVDGTATFWKEVKIGNYFCVVEDQREASVSTVEDRAHPYVLSLPMGRSHVDFVDEGNLSTPHPVPDQPPSFAGYLSVRVVRRNEAVTGLPVRFYSLGPDGDPKGEPLETSTDSDGIAAVPGMFAVGNYLVEIEGATVIVSTVERVDAPYPLQLPLGRATIAEEPESPAPPPSPIQDAARAAGGYLCVLVMFRGKPNPGIPVSFYSAGRDGKRGALISQPETDENGVAAVGGMFVVGNYICEIEGDEVSLTTVESPSNPYIVSLPVGKATISEPEPAPDQALPPPIPDQPHAEPEYLAVRVVSDGKPVAGAKVKFYANLKGDKKGGAVGEAVSDSDGKASLGETFEYGRFWCSVDDRPAALVETTVSVGRPVTLQRAWL